MGSSPATQTKMVRNLLGMRTIFLLLAYLIPVTRWGRITVINNSMLYGAAIGDTIGSKYEFCNIKSKDFPLFSEGCSYTDDTIMTIAVADALLSSNGDKETFSKALVAQMQAYGKKYPYPQGGYGGKFAGWLCSNDPKPYNSFGNGSAMRVSPCGIYAVTLEEALSLAEISASVTHNHPEGVKGAKAVAAAIFMAKSGACKEEIKEYVEGNFYPLNETIDEIRLNYRFNETCQATVPQAITAFIESTNFEDAVRNAVSIGGDTDTVAAITSSIAWVYYYASASQELIAKINSYLPEEFIKVILSFEARSRERLKEYLQNN